MRDIRIEKLAINLLKHSINLQKGEKVLIEILGTDAIPLGKELIKQSEKIGAYPIFNIIDYEIMRQMLINISEEHIKIYAKHDLQKMKDMDAYIGIRATSNTAELNGISKEKIELYNKYYTLPVHFKERVKNTKWCILRYPNNSMAQSDSLEGSDNGNRSSIHWDIVNIQTPEYGGGEIWFDNILVRKDGFFVLEELKQLNPENLI